MFRAALTCYLLLWPSWAWAQLQVPGLDQGPEVRLARTDRLADAATARLERIRRLESLRKPVWQTQTSSTTAYLKEEKELYSQAEEVALRAVEVLAATPRLVPESVSLRTVLGLADRVDSLRLKVRRRQARSEELSTLVPRAGVLAMDELSETVAMGQAEAQLAQAEWILSQVKLRRAKEEFTAAYKNLEVLPPELSALAGTAIDSEKNYRSAEQEAQSRRQQLKEAAATSEVPGPARDVLKAQLKALRWEVQVSKTSYLEATALLKAAEALSAGAELTWTGEFLPGRIASDLDDWAESATELSAEIISLRAKLRSEEVSEQRKLLLKQRSALEAAAGSIAEAELLLRRVRRLQTLLAQNRQSELSALQVAWRALASLLVMALGFWLLGRGPQFILSLISRFHPAERLKLSDKTVGRWKTLIALGWPVLLAAVVASLLIWPIWQLPISPLEALKAVDRALFYVDDTPLSVLSIFKFIFTIWVTIVVSRSVRDFLSRQIFPQLGLDVGQTNAISTFVHYLAVIVGVSFGLKAIGMSLSSLAIFAGVLGIGIGFGLRNITENFISGLIILVERPIKVGDFIDIDGAVEGQVQNIRARSTTVVTRDNISIIIPNSEFVGKQVTNWSHGDHRVRLNVQVGVAYGSDTDLVRRTLLEVASRHGKVLKKPSPEVHLRNFGASSLDFVLLVWIDDQFPRFRIQSDLHFAIDKAFRRVGVEISFPQLDVHFKSVADRVAQRVFASPELVEEEEPKARPRSQSRVSDSGEAKSRSSSRISDLGDR